MWLTHLLSVLSLRLRYSFNATCTALTQGLRAEPAYSCNTYSVNKSQSHNCSRGRDKSSLGGKTICILIKAYIYWQPMMTYATKGMGGS